jgi:hypothetical protein
MLGVRHRKELVEILRRFSVCPSSSLSWRFHPKTIGAQKPTSHVPVGNIEAAIWKNETKSGTLYKVTFKRHYKDGDAWKSTDSFRGDDPLVLAKVADTAHTTILELQQQEGADSDDA